MSSTDCVSGKRDIFRNHDNDTLCSTLQLSYDKIIVGIEACIFREYHILSAVHLRDGSHMNTNGASQPHEGYLDREECANVATSDGEFQRARSFLGIDKGDGPIKTVTRRVEQPFAGVRRHHRIRTSADKVL